MSPTSFLNSGRIDASSLSVGSAARLEHVDLISRNLRFNVFTRPWHLSFPASTRPFSLWLQPRIEIDLQRRWPVFEPERCEISVVYNEGRDMYNLLFHFDSSIGRSAKSSRIPVNLDFGTRRWYSRTPNRIQRSVLTNKIILHLFCCFLDTKFAFFSAFFLLSSFSSSYSSSSSSSR